MKTMSAPISMLSPLSVDGIWWLPEHPEDKNAGTLTFDPVRGGQLDIFGVLVPRGVGSIAAQVWTSEHAVRIPLVHGVTQDGIQFTLSDCMQGDWKLSSPGYQATEYQVGTILRGHHFPNLDSIKFSSIAVTFEQLREWFGRTGIEATGQVAPLTKRGTNDEVAWIKLTSFRSRSISLAADVTLTIANQFTPIEATGSLGIVETPFFVLDFAEPLPIDGRLSMILHSLQLFLTLAVGEGVQLVHFLAAPSSQATEDVGAGTSTVGATSVPNTHLANTSDFPVSLQHHFAEKNDQAARWKHAVEVAYAPTRHSRHRPSAKAHQMLFRYRDVAPRLETVLSKWLACSEALDEIFNLYAATLLGPSSYISVDLLLYAQALELYHRTTFASDSMVSAETLERVQRDVTAALSWLPRDLGDEFARRLSSLNEMRLFDRLWQLGVREQQAIQDHIPDVARFARDLTDVRNFYTHYSRKASVRAEGEDLFYLVQRARVLLEACLLREIGLEPEEIRACLRAPIHYQSLRSRSGSESAVARNA